METGSPGMTNIMKKFFQRVEELMEDLFYIKSPALPEEIKQFLVNTVPWIFLVIILMSLPGIFWAVPLMLLLLSSQAYSGIYQGSNYLLSILIGGLVVVLAATAIRGLFHRERSAWYKMYSIAWILFIGGLLMLNFTHTVIGMIVLFYTLFQIKGKYIN